MPEPSITVTINGRQIAVAPGSTVAAVLMNQGLAFRRSVTGEPRAPLCGMGICYECRVTIDGLANARSCQIVCQTGMRVETAP